jgi:hypothetical protein
MIAFLFVLAAAFAGDRAPIAPRPVAPANGAAPNAVTAFAGDRFLTVWRAYGTFTFVGALSDADGKRVSDAWFPIVHDVPLLVEPLQLIGIGDGYALFWNDFEGVHAAELDLDGRMRRHRIVFPRHHQAVHVGWNGSHYMAVYREIHEATAYAMILDRDFAPVRRTEVSSGHEAAVRVIPSDEAFFVAVVVDSGYDASYVLRIGLTPAGDRPRLKLPSGTDAAGAATTDGGAMIVVSDTAGTLWSFRIDRDNDWLRFNLVERAGQLDFRYVPLHVTQTSSGFRLVLRRHDYTGAPVPFAAVNLDEDGRMREWFFSDRLISARSSSADSNERITLLAVPGLSATANPYTETIAIAAMIEPPVIISRAPLEQSAPRLAWTGRGYLAVWTEEEASMPVMRAAMVGGPAMPHTFAAGHRGLAARISWNGREALVMTRKDDRLYGTRLTGNGTPIDAAPFFIGETHRTTEPSVVWTGDRWIVLYRTMDFQAFVTRAISASGAVGPARPLVLQYDVPEPFSRAGESGVLGWNGRELLLLWTKTLVSNCSDFPPCPSTTTVHATRLDADGQPVDQSIDLDLPAGQSLALAAGESGELLAASGFSTAVIRTAGGVLRADPARTWIDYPERVMQDVLWDGSAFVLAVRYESVWSTKGHIAVLRLDRNGLLRGSGVVDIQKKNCCAPAHSVAAQEGSPALLAFAEVAMPGDTNRVVTMTENELAPIPPPPPAPAAVSRRTRAGTEVSWTAVPGDVDGYLVETDFQYETRRTVTHDRERVMETSSDLAVRVRAFNAGGMSAPAQPAVTPRRQRSKR